MPFIYDIVFYEINLPFDPGIHPLVTDSAFGAPTIEDISSIDAFCQPEYYHYTVILSRIGTLELWNEMEMNVETEH